MGVRKPLLSVPVEDLGFDVALLGFVFGVQRQGQGAGDDGVGREAPVVSGDVANASPLGDGSETGNTKEPLGLSVVVPHGGDGFVGNSAGCGLKRVDRSEEPGLTELTRKVLIGISGIIGHEFVNATVVIQDE